jgi:phosphomannomutase
VLPAAQGQKVLERFQISPVVKASGLTKPSARHVETEATAWHRDRVIELIDAARIQRAHFRVFLDANGGAGGPLGRDLLQALGCQVIAQACDADGLFRHEPEPIASNLGEIGPLVVRNSASVGFVLDPDADRLALIDETGRYIGEELTLALAVLFRLGHARSLPVGPVVINMSTSRISEDLAARFGAPCFRSAVGEANVADKMLEVGAILGGEGNGGIIDPRVGYVRDPFIGMGMILNLLAVTGRKLSELTAELPAYVIVKDKFAIDRDRLPGLFQTLPARWPDAKVDLTDGLRLAWPTRWLHIRSSNTEPIIRVIAEAPRAEEAMALCREAAGLL